MYSTANLEGFKVRWLPTMVKHLGRKEVDLNVWILNPYTRKKKKWTSTFGPKKWINRYILKPKNVLEC